MDKSRMPIFKLVIIGDGGVGKSTFLRRHVCGSFQPDYLPTKQVEVMPIQLNTTHGPVEFVLWDTVGQEKTGSLKQAFYLDAQCAIIMFDLSARETLRSVRLWEKDLRKVCPGIPIVLVGNKCDSEDTKIKSNQIEKYLSPNMDYVSISCLTCENFEQPFILLLRKLLKDSKLDLEINLMTNQIGEDLDSEILGHEFKSDGKD